ncbi:MAG: NHL repeat-containing protein [Pirellulaceae bacterium]
MSVHDLSVATPDYFMRQFGRFPLDLPRAGDLLRILGLLTVACAAGGCLSDVSPPGQPEQVWGRRGISAGRLQKPRAMAIDANNQLYIVDMTGRIQVFSDTGEYLRGWRTPAIELGKPCGLDIARDGNLLVADTHYFRVLVYTPAGQLLEQRTLGGEAGRGPGQFNFVTDAVQDSQGCYYVSEYGECDRIQKFTPEGRYVLQWGGRGREPGQFARPQSLAVDADDHIWVADACNHRIQVFDATGTAARLVTCWGEEGTQPGQLGYPYGLALDGQGHVYVCELGNHRVQKFTLDGQSLGCWGVGGRRAGELSNPWALVLAPQRKVFVLDTYNHRVQQIRL